MAAVIVVYDCGDGGVGGGGIYGGGDGSIHGDGGGGDDSIHGDGDGGGVHGGDGIGGAGVRVTVGAAAGLDFLFCH